MAKTTIQYCTFTLEDLLFGIDVLDVQEVIRYQGITSVALAPDVVEGLINLRGEIITALDLRRRLLLAQRPADRLPMNVVVRTADGPVSLLVDAIGDVIEAHDEDFEAPPETVSGIARELIRGAYKLNGRLLLVLDIQRTVSLPEPAALR